MTSPRLTILSTLAVMGVLRRALPRLEAASGIGASAEYGPTNALLERIAAGATADLAILTEAAIRDLTSAGTLMAGTRVDLARSTVGIAVAAGAALPDIGSVAAFRRLLLETPSLCYSRAGASGVFFAGLLQRLGLAEAVAAKATVIPQGLTGEVLARGEVAVAVQQLSELLAVPGIQVVGPLPAEIGSVTVFSGAVFAGSAARPAALALLRALADPALAGEYAAQGLEAASGAAVPD